MDPYGLVSSQNAAVSVPALLKKLTLVLLKMIKLIEKEESQSVQPDGGALDVCVRTKFNSGPLQFDIHFKNSICSPINSV